MDELSQSDQRARRICSLALAFMNARAPLGTSQLWGEFYEGLNYKAFKQAFIRDREVLSTCGIHLVEHDAGVHESSWSADPDSFTSADSELLPSEAAALAVACQPLLDDPSFALADDLRYALAKLGRSFAEALVGSTPSQNAPSKKPASAASGSVVGILRHCLMLRHAAHIRYVDAGGQASERDVAPFGFFGVRGTLYCVAGRLGEKGELVAGGTRTYRAERVAGAKELARTSYEVPGDFCLDDYRLLPFQIGKRTEEAVFEVPPEHKEGLLRAAAGKGSFTDDGCSALWRVEAASLELAAAWGVAQGILPKEPEGLCEAWEACLRRTAENAPTSCNSLTNAQTAASVPPRKAAGTKQTIGEEARSLVVLLSSLSDAGDAIDTDALSATLNINHEQAQKLVEILLGTTGLDEERIPLTGDEHTGVTMAFGNGVQGRALRLSPSETAAIEAALERLGLAADDPLRKKVEGLGNRGLDEDLVRALVGSPMPGSNPEASRGLLACARACGTGQVVRFAYTRIGESTPEARHALPLRVWSENGAWYLDAWDYDRSSDRTFRIDRINDVQLTGPVGQQRPVDSPGSAAKAGRQVTLLLADASCLETLPWHDLSIVERREDGSAVALIPWYSGEWLPRMICACGGSCTTSDAVLADAAKRYAEEQLARR